MRIPSDADQRSELMAIAIPNSCRSLFQSDGDQPTHAARIHADRHGRRSAHHVRGRRALSQMSCVCSVCARFASWRKHFCGVGENSIARKRYQETNSLCFQSKVVFPSWTSPVRTRSPAPFLFNKLDVIDTLRTPESASFPAVI